VRTVLVIAVHPDDETLGCGGTILKHKAKGDAVHWLICTEASKAEVYYQRRRDEINKVASMYAFDGVHKLGLKSMCVDEYSVTELIQKISAVVTAIAPGIIYLPFKSDVHSDHRRIFEAAYSCTKSFRYPSVKEVLMLETLSETEFAPATKEDTFAPNLFVDISDFMAKKIEIMKVFETELGEHPFPRSLKNIRALATLRGATAGCMYAESFMLLKKIR
jgi:N-acetylglucosamine malate deacetylase 1